MVLNPEYKMLNHIVNIKNWLMRSHVCSYLILKSNDEHDQQVVA